MTKLKIVKTEHQLIKQRLIRHKEVQSKTGLGVSFVYPIMKACEFPQRLNLFERRVTWIKLDINAWIASPIAAHKAAMEA